MLNNLSKQKRPLGARLIQLKTNIKISDCRIILNVLKFIHSHFHVAVFKLKLYGDEKVTALCGLVNCAIILQKLLLYFFDSISLNAKNIFQIVNSNMEIFDVGNKHESTTV